MLCSDAWMMCLMSVICGCGTAKPTCSTVSASRHAAVRSLALLGPNGAGKTTTIEILEGFRMRSAGEVSVLGADPAHGGEAWRARTGVVLQSWRDHAKWQVRELLAQLGTLLRSLLHGEGHAPLGRG